MSLARDGSLGVLSVLWRRVTIEAQLFVHETWAGDAGVLYGPIPDEAACTRLIKERAAALKAAFQAHRRGVLYPVIDLRAPDLTQDGRGPVTATHTALDPQTPASGNPA